MKPRLILAIILLLAIVAVSSWFLYKDDIKQAISPQPLETPDYTLDNFVFNSFTPQGQLDYRIQGVYLEHLPDSEWFHINELNFSAQRANELSWEASAKRAKLTETTHILDLSGDIRVVYYREEKSEPVHMRTEAMTIYAKREYAESKQPTFIDFTNGNFKSHGGFKIDGKARTLKMFGGVKGEMEHD
ncbi:MAG: LPS export ABC transporter periplasmic protein LptC [Gammaproteobacteria bacterium]|nr:LPS export ABC transporter periplasmic protein LptC [Gammaproteobacteria bacterium]